MRLAAFIAALEIILVFVSVVFVLFFFFFLFLFSLFFLLFFFSSHSVLFSSLLILLLSFSFCSLLFSSHSFLFCSLLFSSHSVLFSSLLILSLVLSLLFFFLFSFYSLSSLLILFSSLSSHSVLSLSLSLFIFSSLLFSSIVLSLCSLSLFLLSISLSLSLSSPILSLSLSFLYSLSISLSSLFNLSLSLNDLSISLLYYRELCTQVCRVVEDLIYFCRDVLSYQGLAGETVEEQSVWLRENPDIVVATPARLRVHLDAGNFSGTESIDTIVVDEADLVLSFGHEADVRHLVRALPKTCQGLLMSATLDASVSSLQKVVLHNPEVLTLDGDAEKNHGERRRKEFVVELAAEGEKELFIYTVLKLGIVKGKTLFFVNNVDALLQAEGLSR